MGSNYEELKRIQNKDNAETFDQATDSLEAVSNNIAAYGGTTTADGAAGKTSLIDAGLIPIFGADATAVIGKTVLIGSGPAFGETQVVTNYNIANGEVTFAAVTVQIISGISWSLLVSASSGGGGLVPAPECRGKCYYQRCCWK